MPVTALLDVSIPLTVMVEELAGVGVQVFAYTAVKVVADDMENDLYLSADPESAQWLKV